MKNFCKSPSFVYHLALLLPVAFSFWKCNHEQNIPDRLPYYFHKRSFTVNQELEVVCKSFRTSCFAFQIALLWQFLAKILLFQFLNKSRYLCLLCFHSEFNEMSKKQTNKKQQTFKRSLHGQMILILYRNSWKQAKCLAQQFIFTYRYIDDVLSLKNSKFSEYLDFI